MGEHQPAPERVDALLPVARGVLDRWADMHPTEAGLLGLSAGSAVGALERYIAEALAQVEAGDLGVQGALSRALQRTLDRGRAR